MNYDNIKKTVKIGLISAAIGLSSLVISKTLDRRQLNDKISPSPTIEERLNLNPNQKLVQYGMNEK